MIGTCCDLDVRSCARKLDDSRRVAEMLQFARVCMALPRALIEGHDQGTLFVGETAKRTYADARAWVDERSIGSDGA